MSSSQPEAEREAEALKRTQRSHEASMDEILASIRAIIADDKSGTSALRPAAGPQVIYSQFGQSKSAEPSASAKEPPPPTPAQTSISAPTPTVVWSRPEADLDEPEAPALRQSLQAEDEPLLSAESDQAVSASFQSLAASVALPSPERLEALARETLRPMVKSWLDENLPGLVERLVKAEIQRLARGGR